MSTKNVTICDECGARTDDPYSTRGWVQISAQPMSSVTVRFSHGHDDKNSAVCEQANFTQRDMCNAACFKKWIDKMAAPPAPLTPTRKKR